MDSSITNVIIDLFIVNNKYYPMFLSFDIYQKHWNMCCLIT